MRIDGWRIEAFGALSGHAAEGLASHPLIVIDGDNETGKSTLVAFLATMLHGFSPARRPGHPYAPWSGAPLAGAADLLDAAGAAGRLTRRLDRAPEGAWTCGQTSLDLGNAPLPWLSGLSADELRRRLVIDAEALIGLDEHDWALLEGRLAAARPVDPVRPAHEVLAALRDQSQALWRARGDAGTEHRRVAVALRRLGRLREEADARLRRALELRDRVASKTWQIGEAVSQLAELRGRLRRAEVLLPVLSALQEIERLRARADEWLPEDDLPDDVRGRLARGEARLEERGAELEELLRRIEDHETRVAVPDEHVAVLAVEEDVRALVGQSAVHQQDLVHLNDLDRARDSHEVMLAERAASLLARDLDADVRRAFTRLDVGELQSRLKSLDEALRRPEIAARQLALAEEAEAVAEKDLAELPSADDERRAHQRAEELRTLQSRDAVLTEMKKELEAAEQGRKPDAAPDRDRKRLAWGLVAAGAALVIVMIAGGTAEYGLVSGLAAALVAVGVLVLRRGSSAPDKPDVRRVKLLESQCRKLRAKLELHEYEAPETPLKTCQELLAVAAGRPILERRLIAARHRVAEARGEVKAAGERVEAARAAIAEALAAIPVAPERLASPGQDLLADIDAVRTTVRDIARITGEREAIGRRAADREARARALADKLGLVPTGHAMDIAPLCQERLHVALAARQQAKRAEDELPRLRERAATLAAEQQADRQALAALDGRLAALDPDGGDARQGLRRVEGARADRAQADGLEQDLRRGHPDWEERGDEARAAVADELPLDLPTEEREELRRQIGSFEEAAARLARERTDLVAELERLQLQRGLSDIDGAIAAWRRREERLLRRRDRLELLAAVVREADSRWQQRHEPPVARRAGEHLAAITGGRWTRLALDGRALAVRRGERAPVAVAPPLGRTAREQARLALRVAMGEALLGDDPLPLVLDDVLAGWDDSRLELGVAWIAQLAQRRQVLVVTGQASVAERLAEQAGAARVTLPAAGPGSSRAGGRAAAKATKAAPTA